MRERESDNEGEILSCTKSLFSMALFQLVRLQLQCERTMCCVTFSCHISLCQKYCQTNTLTSNEFTRLKAHWFILQHQSELVLTFMVLFLISRNCLFSFYSLNCRYRFELYFCMCSRQKKGLALLLLLPCAQQLSFCHSPLCVPVY